MEELLISGLVSLRLLRSWIGNRGGCLSKSLSPRCTVGVLCYLLLSNEFPFQGKYFWDLYESIKIGKYSFPEKIWWSVSADAKDFIEFLLRLEPERRPTAEKAMAHKWLANARRNRGAFSEEHEAGQLELTLVEVAIPHLLLELGFGPQIDAVVTCTTFATACSALGPSEAVWPSKAKDKATRATPTSPPRANR